MASESRKADKVSLFNDAERNFYVEAGPYGLLCMVIGLNTGGNGNIGSDLALTTSSLHWMNYSNQVAERLDGVSQGVNPAAVSS